MKRAVPSLATAALLFGSTVVSSAAERRDAGPAFGDSLEVRGRVTVDDDGRRLVLRFDLPAGDEYDVRLVVDLGGRRPSLHHPRTVDGDVGESVPGGPGRTAVWHAFEDQRRLTSRESAWVVAIPAAARLPLVREGPLADMRFAYVPAGSFWMGSQEGEQWRHDNEGPIVPRSFAPFEMTVTEITQAQFEEVMGFNPSKLREPTRPVEQVSWFDAVLFCDRLGERDPGHVYRLPSEAEWEYACRAGTSTPYSGELEPGAPAPEGDAGVAPYGWYSGNAGGKSRPVGLLEANAWGLHDMHGNVWEWCADAYGERHAAPGTVPRVQTVTWPPERARTPRVVRGGSWRSPAHRCRSASRESRNPEEAGRDVGLRVVRVPAT